MRNALLLILLSLALPAYAQQTSTVDATYPATNDDIDAFGLQKQFQAVHDDLDDLFEQASGAGSGTVTSIAFAGDGFIFPSTTSAAITTNGVLRLPSPLPQAAGTFFSGPVSGSAARPLYRPIFTSDLTNALATSSAYGAVKPDNSTITISNGVISAAGGTPGITALTGDVIATGPGSSPATLAASGVTAGIYTNPNFTVNAKGLVTNASNGTPSSSQTVTASSPLAASTSGTNTNIALSTAVSVSKGGSGSVLNGYIPVTKRFPNSQDDYTQGYFGDGSVDNLYLSNSVTSCSGTPTCTAAAPASGGINATCHFAMTGSGAPIAAVIDNPGRGYTSRPSITVANTTGCSTTPTVTAYITPNGQMWLAPDGNIYQIHQADAGHAIWTLFPSQAFPLDSVVNAVTAAAPSAAGTGYNVADTITLANGTVLQVATLTAGAGSGVATVTVQTGGSWQCYTANAQPQVSTSGSGTSATFTLTANWAQAAYGTRRLTACYTTNKVADFIRASDSSTITIGFNGDAMDLSTLAQFAAGTTVKWTKAYDQSGRANDATQGTDANRPIMDFSLNLNGIPYMAGGAMTISSGATWSTSSMSAYSLNSAQSEAGFIFSAGSAPGLQADTNSNQYFQIASIGGAFWGQSTYFPAAYPEVIGASISSTTAAMSSIQDFEFQCTSGFCAGSTTSTTGGGLGGSSSSSLSMSMFASWPRPLTESEVASLRASIYKTFKVAPQVRDILVTSGDSRTAGVGSTGGGSYPSQIKSLLAGSMMIYNTGNTGDKTSDRLANFYNSGSDARLMLLPHGKNSKIMMWIGYNDATESVTEATAYANLTSYISNAHALGINVALATDPETSSAYGLNTAILANAAGADEIIDMNADPVWTTATNWASQTFLNSPPHLSNFGYGYVASDLANGLNAYFSPNY